MIRPTLDHAIAFNRSERREDEVVRRTRRPRPRAPAAAVLAYRIARTQGFGEGNKRTALLLARWLLDRNGKDGLRYVPANDRVVADLLVAAAGGRNVEHDLVKSLRSRR